MRPGPNFRPTPLQDLLTKFDQRHQSVVVISRFEYGTNGHSSMPPFPLTSGDWFTERGWHGNAETFAPKIMGRLGKFKPKDGWAHHWSHPNPGYIRINPSGEEVTSFGGPGSGSWIYEPIRLVSHLQTPSEATGLTVSRLFSRISYPARQITV